MPDHLLDHPFGWLSLLPPLVAIALAIVTRRIVLSLVLGIFAGALLMAGGDPLIAIYHTWETHLWRTLIDSGKLRVFSFTIVMGAMIGVITQSGGMRGLIKLISPYASNRRRGQLATWLMGMIIFFDDYANTILLGSTLRPVCDRLKISREKLAYLVDSTAAPVAGLAPLSTWVAVEIAYIAGGLEAIPDAVGMSAFGLFLSSIPYRFYIWSALLLVPITAWLGRDIGPMVAAERRAMEGYVPDENLASVGAVDKELISSWYNAVLPIALTLALVMYFIYSTGSAGACNAAAGAAQSTVASMTGESDEAVPPELRAALDALAVTADSGNLGATRRAFDELMPVVASTTNAPLAEVESSLRPKLGMRDVLGEADSSLALQYGALAGLGLAFLLPLVSRQMKVDQLVSGAASGARVVLPAVAILWTASAMSNMTRDTSVDGDKTESSYEFKDHRLYTADYLTRLVAVDNTDATNLSDSAATGRSNSAKFFPTLVFVLAGVVAFCTGTSWGTMGILVPMVVQTAYALLAQEGAVVSPTDPILLSSIGGVLAGAVFGDHCSPISDTTVLSSQSSGCDHLSHVWTQMPYALLAAVVSILLGTLPIGFGVSVWLLLPMQIFALWAFMRLFGSRT